MQRLFRLTAALVASLMVLFAAGPVLVSAQAGVTSATTYESTLFGYEVEWTEDWAVVENFTRSLESSDQLRIVNEAIGIWIDIWGFDTNRSAESMMGPYTDLLVNSESSIDVESEELDSSLPDAGVMVYNYLFGSNQTPLEELTEFRPIDGAFIITSVKAAPGRSQLAATLVSVQVTIDGDPIFPALFGESDQGDDADTDEDTDTDEDQDTDEDVDDQDDTPVTGAGLDGNIYVSPNFGVALSFDESQWEVGAEVEAEDEDGRDVLQLDLIDSSARLWLEAYGTITSASECIDSASQEVIAADVDFELLEDQDGEELEGSTRGVAWTSLMWEDDDVEQAAYVECRAIPGQTGVFVVTLISTLDDFEDAYEALTELLTSVSLEDGEPAVVFDAVDADDEDADTDQDADEDEDADQDEDDSAGGATYESPTWGFTLTIDESTWEIGRERSRNDVDTLTLEGDGDMFVEMSAFELGRRDDAQSCVEDAIDNFDFEIEVGEEDDAGETFSVLGSYLDDDDEEWAVVITCSEDPAGDFVVQFVGEAPIDAEDDLLDAMSELANSVEFP